MSGKCWVCKRQARGFGYSDNQYRVGNPRRYPVDWVLVDAWVPGMPGGTGRRIDPAVARGLPAERLFVAGGLDPDSVADVVRAIRPFAVDVASGVERAPGIKDHGKVAEFVRRALAA